MPFPLFSALDTEWNELIGNRSARRTVDRWRADPVLGRFDDLVSIVATLRRGASDPAATNQILAALVARAPNEPLAARTLLQALVPGLINVAKRLAGTHVDDDLEAQVITEAIDRIQTYPL